MTLREFRRAHNLTQMELADRIGISRVTISRIEASNERPTFTIMQGIAKAFGLRLAYVVAEFYTD